MIWILIAARSWQWAVVGRNKQNFTFISFNVGTVKEYTVTWIIFILPPWRVTELLMERCENLRYGRNREFTLILSVNSRLYGAWIHAYSIHEFALIWCVNSRLFDAWIQAYSMRESTLIRCVNARLYKASINTCTKCEVMSEDSEDLAFLNHVISRDQNFSCNHSPLPRPGCD